MDYYLSIHKLSSKLVTPSPAYSLILHAARQQCDMTNLYMEV